jgi:4-hydroxybenzoate polyprenyltransferase
MFIAIKTWLSFVRFSHTIFALPFALRRWWWPRASNAVARGRTFLLILAAMVASDVRHGLQPLMDRNGTR